MKKTESELCSKPLSVKVSHWAIVFCFTTALLTGYTAFDFDWHMTIQTRDALFALHRFVGLMSIIVLLVWGGMRFRSLWPLKTNLLSITVSTFHVFLWILCLAIPISPWIARSLDGRSQELYSLLPIANLVSHPTTLLSYKLLQLHKDFIEIMLILLFFHIAAVLIHGFILKDNLLEKMLFPKN